MTARDKTNGRRQILQGPADSRESAAGSAARGRQAIRPFLVGLAAALLLGICGEAASAAYPSVRWTGSSLNSVYVTLYVRDLQPRYAPLAPVAPRMPVAPTSPHAPSVPRFGKSIQGARVILRGPGVQTTTHYVMPANPYSYRGNPYSRRVVTQTGGGQVQFINY